MSLLIKNGEVVTASDRYRADVLVEDELVVEIGQTLEVGADTTIDAEGKYLFPGGVDPHTHMNLPFMGTVTIDDYESGTIAAACGGTTSVVDFAFQGKGMNLAETLTAWKKKAEGKAVIDYSFHVAITDLPDEVLNEVPAMVKEGVASFKLFMAYKGAVMVDDATLYKMLLKSKECGALVSVHAENGDVIDVLVKQFLAEGKTDPLYHALSRPAEVEAEATGRMLDLAYMADAPTYIVHLSASQALDRVKAARARGQHVFAETCPQYLFLTSDCYQQSGFEGAKCVISPPLREAWHHDVLWKGLRNGDLQTIGSDHCPFNYEGQKDLGKGDFSKIPNGGPGIEERLGLIYTGGVLEGRIGLNRFVDLVSTTPAKLFGLYPKKGTIAVGSDADIVVFDPTVKHTLSVDTHHSRIDYNAYEGYQVVGRPTTVLSRGNVIVQDGKFVGQAGMGQFIKRKPFDLSLVC